MGYRIPLSAPLLIGREREYVRKALDQNQLSAGEFVTRFEEAFANYVGTKHAIAVSNGTTALHLALHALVKPKFVSVTTLTYIAAPNAIRYVDAAPYFLDVDPETWQSIAPANTTRLPHLAVHSYGIAAPVPTDRPVLEDCAEALGTRVGGRHVGTFGLAGTFSFYGNKVITCGEGGMVVTDDAEVAARCRLLKGQGQDPEHRYHHIVLGYNYRMTNLQAAIGLAQLEQIEEHLERRKKLMHGYVNGLWEVMQFPKEPKGTESSPWLMVGAFKTTEDKLRVEQACAEASIETRPVFPPCHRQHHLTEWGKHCPVADGLYARGLVLPLHAGLSGQDVDEICSVVRKAVRV